MDGEAENEVKEDMGESSDSSKGEDKSHNNTTVNGHGKEGVPDEEVALDNDGSLKTTEEESSENEPPATSEEEVNEENDDDDDATPSHEAEEEESSAADDDGDEEHMKYEEHMQLLQQLCEDRSTASQRLSVLHMKLLEFIPTKAADEGQTDRQTEPLLSDQLQLYQRHMDTLTELQQQLHTDSESAQQQAEELRVRAQQMLEQAEEEWRHFLSQKQDVAVTVLSRRLGNKAAQAKVEEVLATETLLQNELIKVCHKHIQLKIKTHRLEAELCEREDHARDPLQVLFEQLQADRLELNKHTEKRNEDSLKLQKKISSSLELLSNVKEKLFWSQAEVQAQRQQLVQVEAMVAQKRELLTRTRQARNGLQKDNQRLKELRGLLGNRVLLRDFEDTVDASEHLEEHLEDLKCQQDEMVFSSGTA